MDILLSSVVEVQLTQGLVTWIDAEDFELVTQFKWQVAHGASTNYVRRTHCKKTVLLHRFLLNAPSELHVDHINGDGLRNTRINLRLCTQTENNRNAQKRKGTSSEYKGVRKHNQGCPKPWEARIKVDKKSTSRSFATEIEAALWYDSMAREHFGEFANLNFQQR